MSTDSDREDRDPPGRVVATRVVPARRRRWPFPRSSSSPSPWRRSGSLARSPFRLLRRSNRRRRRHPSPWNGPRSRWTRRSSGPPSSASWSAHRAGSSPSARTSPIGIRSPGPRRTAGRGSATTSRQDTFGGGVPDAAAQVGSSFVAVGYHATVNGITREIWNSPDGATWARDPSPTGRGFDAVRAFVGSRGTAILIASIGGRQALLSSEDGRLWTAAADLDATLGRGAFIREAIDSGDGYLAVGSIGNEAAIWRSTDGRVWSHATQTDPSVFAGARFDRLVRTTGGFLLSGSADRSGGSTWVSDDGVTWVPDTTSAIGLQDLGAVLALDGANLGIPYDAIGSGFGALTVWADPQSSFTTASPTDAPTDWRRQATVFDGHVVLLAQHAATGTIGVWLGSVVGSGVVPASPTPGPSGAQGSAGSSPSAAPLPTRPQDPTVPTLDWVRLTSHEVLSDDIRDVWMAGVVNMGPKLVAFGSVGTTGSSGRPRMRVTGTACPCRRPCAAPESSPSPREQAADSSRSALPWVRWAGDAGGVDFLGWHRLVTRLRAFGRRARAADRRRGRTRQVRRRGLDRHGPGVPTRDLDVVGRLDMVGSAVVGGRRHVRLHPGHRPCRHRLRRRRYEPARRAGVGRRGLDLPRRAHMVERGRPGGVRAAARYRGSRRWALPCRRRGRWSASSRSATWTARTGPRVRSSPRGTGRAGRASPSTSLTGRTSGRSPPGPEVSRWQATWSASRVPTRRSGPHGMVVPGPRSRAPT